jgi:hypothetical protein
MLTALALICNIAATPDLRLCDRQNAVHVMQVPGEFSMPFLCLKHGQAFLAETAMAREMTVNERVKVVCIRSAVPKNVG